MYHHLLIITYYTYYDCCFNSTKRGQLVLRTEFKETRTFVITFNNTFWVMKTRLKNRIKKRHFLELWKYRSFLI